MRRKLFGIVFGICLMLSLMLVTAWADGANTNPVVGITVSGTLQNTHYTYGEALDLTGLTVTANRQDGSIQDVTASTTAAELHAGQTNAVLSYVSETGAKFTQTTGAITVAPKEVTISGLSAPEPIPYNTLAVDDRIFGTPIVEPAGFNGTLVYRYYAGSTVCQNIPSNPGSYTVRVSAVGDYTGHVDIPFTIIKSTPVLSDVSFDPPSPSAYSGQHTCVKFKLTTEGQPVVGEHTKITALKDGVVYKDAYCTTDTDGYIECEIDRALSPGYYAITISFEGDKNLNPVSKTVDYSVLGDRISAISVNPASGQHYEGKVLTFHATVLHNDEPMANVGVSVKIYDKENNLIYHNPSCTSDKDGNITGQTDRPLLPGEYNISIVYAGGEGHNSYVQTQDYTVLGAVSSHDSESSLPAPAADAGTMQPIDSPDTGDGTMTFLWAAALFLSAGAASAMVFLRGKRWENTEHLSLFGQHHSGSKHF